MSSSTIWPDYTIVIHRREDTTLLKTSFTIALDSLASTRKGKLVINPIYRVFSRSKDGVHFWRRREHDKWELECLGMLKAMPLDVVIPSNIMNDIKHNRVSEEMEPFLKRGVIVELPIDFI